MQFEGTEEVCNVFKEIHSLSDAEVESLWDNYLEFMVVSRDGFNYIQVAQQSGMEQATGNIFATELSEWPIEIFFVSAYTDYLSCRYTDISAKTDYLPL